MSADLDQLPCGYVRFHDDGIIEHCNELLTAWVGWPREKLIGKSIESIFTLSTRIFYNTHFFPLIKLHGHASEIFLNLKNQDSSDVAVLANATYEQNGKNSFIRCVFMKIQERKKYEQELLNARRTAEQALRENRQLAELTTSLEKQAILLDQQYQKQLSINENLLQFSKIISHDFQEPIRKIQLFADLIANDLPQENSRSRALCTKIDAAAKNLKVLATGLQQYVLVDTEKHYSLVDLNEIVAAAKTRARETRQFSNFTFEADRLPTIQGYRKQLELLFYHLFDNAIQFRHPDRTLEIKMEATTLSENVFKISKENFRYTEHVRIVFRDNGIGLSPQYSEYVFELLKKMDGSGEGLGLGLSLVKKIIHNHAGVISISSNPGLGTALEMTIPTQVEAHVEKE